MSLKSKFIEHLKKSVVSVLNRTNGLIRISSLSEGINRVVSTKRFNRPMLTPNLLERFEEPPEMVQEKHNRNIDELTADTQIINDTIEELHEKSDLITLLRNNAMKMINKAFTIVKDKITDLRRAYMIDVQTITESFENVENISSIEGAIVDSSKGILTLQQPVSPLSSVTPDEGDVRVEILNNIAFSTPRNDTDILNITNDNLIQFIAVADQREQVQYRITITFPTRPINQVAINLNNTVPLTASIKVNDRVKAKDQVLLKGVYLFNFKQVKRANLVQIDLVANNEDYVRNGVDYIYALKLVHINVRNAAYNLSGEVISKELSFNSPITDIAIKVDENIPSGAKAKYYIADAANPDNWILLKPTHDMFESQNWVSIGSRSEINKLVEIDHIISPEANSGNSLLYNILDGISDETVTNGALNIPDGWEVDTKQSTITLGINDYVIDYDYLYTKAKSILTEYQFPTTTNDFIEMYTKINNETHMVVDHKVTLNYTPRGGTLLITDKTKMYDSYTINGKEVTVSGSTNGGTLYVTYNTKLIDIETTDNVTIEIIPDTIQVRAGITADPENYSELIEVLIDEKRLRLRPTSSVGLDVTSSYYILYVSFDYYLKTNNKFKQFKTNALYTSTYDLGILPFTDEEIVAGNIHTIDGVNVSKLTEYTLEPGWHQIVTTQPFPSNSDNSNDVNHLTEQQSNAGIILENFDKMQAYTDKMRFVSLHRLSNVVAKDDHRSFTISEGEILVNFYPDVLVQPVLDGDLLSGRTVEWFGRRVNSFKLNYPKLEVRIVLKPTKDNTTDKVQSIKYKVELSRTPITTSPIVDTLEIYGV